MIDIGSVLAFGAAFLKGTSLAVTELIGALPAFIVERIVKLGLALLALFVVRAEIAAADQLAAVLADVVGTDAKARLAGLAVSSGVAGKAVLEDAATRAVVVIVDVEAGLALSAICLSVALLAVGDEVCT